MNNDRSPDTATPSDDPRAETGAADTRDTPQPRGLFGRLIDAFGGGESDADAERDGENPPGSVLGMGNLRRMRVDDVAIPKAEIVAVPATTDLAQLVEIFREHGFSRIPVFRGSLDTPLGLIHLKDLALKYGFGAEAPQFALRAMLRPLLYVPPSMPIGVLLQQMQQKRIHMAMVIDEYGGVDGLVTIEDLIEQIIGAIEDEHDEIEDGLMFLEKPGQWLIQSRVPLEAVERETGLRLSEGDEDEIDTLGGLIFMLNGHVPVIGEIVTHGSGAQFEIVEADPRRVRKVRLRMPPQET